MFGGLAPIKLPFEPLRVNLHNKSYKIHSFWRRGNITYELRRKESLHPPHQSHQSGGSPGQCRRSSPSRAPAGKDKIRGQLKVNRWTRLASVSNTNGNTNTVSYWQLSELNVLVGAPNVLGHILWNGNILSQGQTIFHYQIKEIR